MRQAVKRGRHGKIDEQRARKSATCRKTFERTLRQIDLSLLTQAELATALGVECDKNGNGFSQTHGSAGFLKGW